MDHAAEAPVMLSARGECADAAARSAALAPSYVHHARGRLRAKFARLAGDTAAIAETESRLARIPGVTAVKGNPLIGSLIVAYDPGVLSPASIPGVLREQGLAIDRAAVSPKLPPAFSLATLAE